MIRRIALIAATFVCIILLSLYGVLYVAFLGPSTAARNQLALSMLETSALKSLPGLFLSAEIMDHIIADNLVVDPLFITDTSLIRTYKPSSVYKDAEGFDESGAVGSDSTDSDEWLPYPDGIRIETIKGATYRGYVMFIRDPSRVYAATSSNFKNGAPGLKITDAIKKEGAVAAINGGGFPDVNGVGLGDVPLGIVFSKGEHLWGNDATVYSGVMGFDANDVLIVGSMSPNQAREIGIRDAICFGPVLVVNGEPTLIRGVGGGLNPRSAIGQRADGTVLFVCVDGRMPSSMGASFQDLTEIMVSYGAVNAANLDGGSSSHLLYNDEIINISSSLYGPRRLPTFFMVKP